MSSDEKLDQILRRLDLIVSLMLEGGSEGDVRLEDKIVRLHGLGLSPAEISRILHKPINQITSTLSRQRKKA